MLFYDELVYKFKKLTGRNDFFSFLFYFAWPTVVQKVILFQHSSGIVCFSSHIAFGSFIFNFTRVLFIMVFVIIHLFSMMN